MTNPSADNPGPQPLGLPLNDQLGPEERAKLDALLDHIYEYGTTAEGVPLRAAQLCQAARAAERERLAAEAQAAQRAKEEDDAYWGAMPARRA